MLSHGQAESIEVVDLQSLGLDQIKKRGNTLQIGATVTLQQLLESAHSPAAVKASLRLEAPLNLRDAATVAGTLAVCDGRSSFVTVLLAMDAKLTLMRPRVETIGLGEFLPVRLRLLQGALIAGIEISLVPRVEFDRVARTPMDAPILAVALAQWPSGRCRLALGGWGSIPTLAMDGTEVEGLNAAARNACHDASDPWGSAEYRMHVAATLANRCLTRLTA